MATKLDDPAVKERRSPLQLSPRRWSGWFRRFQNRVKLALQGDDEELVIENKTGVSWRIYHNYHQLGIIDAGEQRKFKLVKHGSLSARPYIENEEVEYLVLPLTQRVYKIHIYQRHLAEAVEVYDMRVA